MSEAPGEPLTTGGRETCFKRAGEAPWTCSGGDVRAAAPVAGSEGMHMLTTLDDGGCSMDAAGLLACWSATPTQRLSPGAEIEDLGPVGNDILGVGIDESISRLSTLHIVRH